MVLPVSEVFSRYVSQTVKPAFLLEKFAEDLRAMAGDLNQAMVMAHSNRDIYVSDITGGVDLCIRAYQEDCVRIISTERSSVYRGVPEIIVGASLYFDPEAKKFKLYINRDPEGYLDKDSTQTLACPLNEEGLQSVSVAVASLLDEYLELPEKMAYFRVISQKNAQAVLAL